MAEYQSPFPVNKYKFMYGTLNIHEVTTNSNSKFSMLECKLNAGM